MERNKQMETYSEAFRAAPDRFAEVLAQHLAAREAVPYSTSLREPLRLAREMRSAMAAVDRTYDNEYMADGRAAIAKSEMLNVCIGLLNIAETGVVSLGAIRAARAVIAKATGSAS
jgi:hypothetical protein